MVCGLSLFSATKRLNLMSVWAMTQSWMSLGYGRLPEWDPPALPTHHPGSKVYILTSPITLRKTVKVISECMLSLKHGACVFLHSAQPRREVQKENLQATSPSDCCAPGVRVRWAVLLVGPEMLSGHWATGSCVGRHGGQDGGHTPESCTGKVERLTETTFPSLKKNDFGFCLGQSTLSSHRGKLSVTLIHSDARHREPWCGTSWWLHAQQDRTSAGICNLIHGPTMFFLLLPHHLLFQLAKSYSYFCVSLNITSSEGLPWQLWLMVFPVVVSCSTICFFYFSEIIQTRTHVIHRDMWVPQCLKWFLFLNEKLYERSCLSLSHWATGTRYKITTFSKDNKSLLSLKLVMFETSDVEALTCSCICFLMQSGHTSFLVSGTCGCDYLSTYLSLPPDSDFFKGNSLWITHFNILHPPQWQIQNMFEIPSQVSGKGNE